MLKRRGVDTSTISIMFGDGTFKVTPPQFKQVWVVCVRIGNSHIPIVYALLEDKKKESYIEVLRFLRVRCPLLDPTTIIMDFEIDEHKVVRTTFPSIRIQVCNFHFNQCNLKKFRKNTENHTDEVLRILLRCVYGLPFLPLSDVAAGWTDLKCAIWARSPSPAMSAYIKYFEDTWLFSSCYPPSLWNVTLAMHNGEPRTNNASEGGNNAINTAASTDHPSIWAFIPILRTCNAEMEQKLLLLQSGLNPDRKQREEAIQRLVRSYKADAKLGMMRCLGYRFSA